MTIRVVIADDHPIVLEGLVQLFSMEQEFGVVARANNGEMALRAVREFLPDILVLDLRMPVKSGLWVLGEMKRDKLATRAVVLTAVGNEEVVEAIRLGARGVVLKDIAPRVLLQCVREVHAGAKWVEKGIATRAIDDLLKRDASIRVMAETLTRREMEIARMITEGLPSKTIANRLAISEGTAKLHLHHVYEKLRLDGRMALVRYMQKHGLA